MTKLLKSQKQLISMVMAQNQERLQNSIMTIAEDLGLQEDVLEGSLRFDLNKMEFVEGRIPSIVEEDDIDDDDNDEEEG